MRARKPARDPFVARLLLLVGAIATLAPLAFILRSGSGNSLQSGRLPGAAAILEAGSASAPPETEPAATTRAPLPAPDAGPDSTLVAGVVATSPATTAAASVTQPAATTPSGAATTSFECPKVYEVVAGDYWVLIAQKHQISLDLLLGQNGATPEQPLFPGRVLCLPAEAQDPSLAPTTTPKVSKTTTAADKASTSTKKIGRASCRERV